MEHRHVGIDHFRDKLVAGVPVTLLLSILVMSCEPATTERGGIPTSIYRFAEAVPVVGPVIYRSFPVPESDFVGQGDEESDGSTFRTGSREATANRIGGLNDSRELVFRHFTIVFEAFGKQFVIYAVGDPPDQEPLGPDCSFPDEHVVEPEKGIITRPVTGEICRRRSPSRGYSVYVDGQPAARGFGTLRMTDGEWSGSIEITDENYVIKQRSYFDDLSPPGTVIIYRSSDAEPDVVGGCVGIREVKTSACSESEPPMSSRRDNVVGCF